jgi:flagellar hook protein FlgE
MAFYTSLSGLNAAQTDLSTIANNIANVNSMGFKKSRAEFGDLFASSNTQNPKMINGQGAQVDGIVQQFTQGTIASTGNTLDLAIAGQGFFVVNGGTLGNGVSYTRNGSFQVNANNQVVDATGGGVQLLPVDSAGNVISTSLSSTISFVLPTASPTNPAAALSNISIGQDGLATATFADGSTQKLGKIALASFPAESGLRPIGNSHWQATGNSGVASVNAPNTGSLGAIQSGAIEESNVDITTELVALINAQRNFQANSKAIETDSAITQSILNIRG